MSMISKCVCFWYNPKYYESGTFDIHIVTVADPEVNLGGGGFSRPEGPSGEVTGGVSPEKILKKKMQSEV